MRTPQERLINANVLFLQGKHRDAFDGYTDIIRTYPDAIAASNLGYMYHRGIAVVRDYAKAREFYIAASEEDGGVALFNLALMYLRGQGVSVDFGKAKELMQRSADHGCVDAKLYLGLAYLLGCMYDPIEIECLSLIPFYRVIYRDASMPLLAGGGYDPQMEDLRYEVIECDADDAFEMYASVTEKHSNDPYAERQLAAAAFMKAKFYIEGVGNRYNPCYGYRLMERAAIFDYSREAAEFLLANREKAGIYKVNVPRLEMLCTCSYFRPTMGNLGTPYSHRVPLLLPTEN